MSALLPCPHCGNDGSGPIEAALQIHHNEPDYVHDHRHTWTVQCDKCTATMGYSDSEDEAVEAWNRRAPSPSPAPGVVEALRAIGAPDEIQLMEMSDSAIRGWAYAANRIARDMLEETGNA